MALILLVDDDELLRSTVKTILTLAGHDVRVAPDGKFALKLLEDLKPDVIFTDNDMPGMSGVEFVKKLGVELLDRTVMVTGGTPEEYVPVPIRQKPLSKREFLEEVDRVRARTQRELEGLRSLIEGGDMFVGNAVQFEDTFLFSPTRASVESFCGEKGWSVEFVPEETR